MPPTASVPPAAALSYLDARCDPRRRDGCRGAGDPPGLRLPLRERRVRPRLRRGRHRLHRAGGARPRRHGRQDPLEGARVRERRAGRSGHRCHGAHRRRDRGCRGRRRLPAADQAVRRRRRQGHAGRARGGRPARGARRPRAAWRSAAFGDDTLLLERLIERPRHIEVQVIAAADGTVLHLGERECTLQRRHQKVIEEAPSPIVDAATRERLGAAACAAAASVDYRGAGHGRVPRRRRASGRVLLHRDEHPPAGRAPGHRARHGARPRRAAAARRRRRAARHRAGRRAAHRARDRGARVRREPRRAASCPRRATVLGWIEPTGPGVRVGLGDRDGLHA